jgi:hypothetical protein
MNVEITVWSVNATTPPETVARIAEATPQGMAPILGTRPIFDAAKAAIPNLDEHFRAGDFSPLLGWLRTNVHQWGRRRTASEILVAATGSDLDATPWMTYLRRKYEALVAR